MDLKIGQWPEYVHNSLDQIKRIQSGKKLKKKIMELDLKGGADSPVVVIQGSARDPYVATLNSCTCADFSIRELPCKHIYCLADQLGLLSGLPAYDKKKASFDPASDLKKYKDLFEAGQKSMDAYIKIGTVLEKMIK